MREGGLCGGSRGNEHCIEVSGFGVQMRGKVRNGSDLARKKKERQQITSQNGMEHIYDN